MWLNSANDIQTEGVERRFGVDGTHGMVEVVVGLGVLVEIIAEIPLVDDAVGS
jgi:hypothetical protein